LRGRGAFAGAAERARELADRLHLDLRTPIKNMSKGNKQKVGVIQAFMHPAELLLLDEPTSGLDPLMQQEVYDLVREAQAAGATVFFSSHIIGEVEAIAGRVAVIRDGRIAQVLDPRELYALAVRRVRVRFREPLPEGALVGVFGATLIVREGDTATIQLEGEMDALIKALAAYPVIDLETERPTLEEVFLTLYE